MKTKPLIHFQFAVITLVYLSCIKAIGYDNEQLRKDLQSEDPLVYKQATLNAVQMPTPETVRDLMAIVLSKDPKARTGHGVGDVAYGAPRTYALRALSRILPNPPATFSQKGRGGAEVYFLELWQAWWEENHRDFDGPDAKMPERHPDSIYNLSVSDRVDREHAHFEKSYKLYHLLTMRQVRRPGSQWDEIVDEYLEERRQARAAERALAKREATPSESPIIASGGTSPPGAASASGGNGPPAFAWIVALGILALVAALVATALHLRRKHVGASA